MFVLLAVTAVPLLAQCNPDPNLSTCVLSVIKNDACPTTMPKTLVWCPDGDMSYFEIEVTLIDVNNLPCANTDVRVIVSLSGRTLVAGNNLFGCGFNLAGERIFALTTNAAGKAYAKFWGGGCGCLHIEYFATTSGFVLCTGVDDFCVKSPDLNGDGFVNFLDVFQFLPCLGGLYGVCCDFNCDGTITFLDTFAFLPHLGGAHICVGSILPFRQCSSSLNCF